MKLTVAEIGKNMETMAREFDAKRREMEALENEIGDAELNRAKARKLERQKENLQNQLREIANRRNAVIDTFSIPEVRYITEKEEKTRWRGGLLGILGTILIGKKHYYEAKDPTVDKTSKEAHDEAQKQRDEILGSINSEHEKLIKEMSRYESTDTTSSEEFDAEIQRKSRQLEKMNADYKAEVEKYMADMDADADKARKKILREIKSYMEEFTDENIQSINKYLAGTERKMFDSVKAIIESRVNAEIERQKKKLDMLIEDSKASDAARDEKLQKATAAKERVSELLGRVAELEVELDEMTDQIAEGA